MIILTLRTDKPEAEIGLFEGDTQLAYEKWEAHRQLATTLHDKIRAILKSQNKDWHDIGGVACFEGPGSFTGLRIGMSVANALAANLKIPIVAAQGDEWRGAALQKLLNGENQKLAMPYYGADAHITTPRK